MLLITLNIDDNIGLVAPFMRKHGYTFPVLFAKQYFDRVAPELGIPQAWIVDPEGVLRRFRVGLGTDENTWLRDVLRVMATVAQESAKEKEREEKSRNSRSDS